VPETIPGCIGGWLAGTIETRAALVADTMHVDLRCIRRVTTGSGRDRMTTESTVWEDTQVLTGRLPPGKAGGSAIPVAFRLPADVPPTERPDSRNEIYWKLRAHAAMGGPDYVAEFSVPVFHAAATQPAGFVPAADRVAERLRDASPPQARRGDDPSIGFSIASGGRKRFVFPGGRNPKAELSLLILAVLFGGVGVAMLVLCSEIVPRFLFGILFTLIGVPCLYGAVVMCVRHVELQVDPHGVRRQRRVLGMQSEQTIAVDAVKSITYETNMSLGGTAYYTVYAKLKAGDLRTLASSLHLRDAKWVATEIAQSLGVVSSEVAASDTVPNPQALPRA
jgi:hypothetical protein